MELWERRRLLGRQVIGKRRLYLDMRYWNDLCDATIGANQSDSVNSCLAVLRKSVAAGRTICPVEFHVVTELYKQKLVDKQEATLAVIDELSARAVLVSAPERLFLEVLRLVQALIAKRPLPAPPVEELWTRPLFVAGHRLPDFPEAEGVPSDLLREVQRQIEDEWWECGFSEMIATVGGFPSGIDDKAATADLLNRAKADSSTLLKSYESTYWSEVLGTLDGYLVQLGEVNLYLFARAGGDPTTVAPEQSSEAARRLRNLLYHGARKRGLRGPAPSLHISATLYAHLQWDRKRKYRSNDIFDFGHAEAALPYCHAFATDKAFAALLRDSGLAAEYDCEVLTDMEAVSAWVEQVAL